MRRTASGRTVRPERVSAAISCASVSARKLSAPRPPVRSSARAAVAKSAHTASRSRSALRPAAPPRREARSRRVGQRVPFHSSHSASSAVPPFASRERVRARRRPSSRAAFAYAASCAMSRSGSASARASRTSEGGGTGLPPARSSARSARPSRRRSAASMPHRGEARRSTAVSVAIQEGSGDGCGRGTGWISPSGTGSPSASGTESPSGAGPLSPSPAGVSPTGGVSPACGVSPRASASAVTRRAVRRGWTAGSRRSGSSSPAVSTGTPAAVRERRRAGRRLPARRRTAMSPHGTSSSRWARRRRSATWSVSAPGLGHV